MGSTATHHTPTAGRTSQSAHCQSDLYYSSASEITPSCYHASSGGAGYAVDTSGAIVLIHALVIGGSGPT